MKKEKKSKKDKKVKRTINSNPSITSSKEKVIENTTKCIVHVVNNQLPWDREILSEYSIIKFEIKGGKKYSIRFDEKNSCLDIVCENSPCNIQPMTTNHFMIK